MMKTEAQKPDTKGRVLPFYVEGRETWADEYGSILDLLPTIALRFQYLARRCRGLAQRGTRLRILDLGAAYGYYAAVLHAHGHDVYAIEWAEDAALKVTDLLGPGKVFRQSVADPFPLPDASIDLAYAFDLIEHADDDAIRAMLGECERVLAPEGLFLISTPNSGRIARLIFRALGLAVPKIPYLLYGPDHTNLFTAARLQSLLAKSLRHSVIREVSYSNFMFGRYPIASIVDNVLLRHIRASANIIAVIEKQG